MGSFPEPLGFGGGGSSFFSTPPVGKIALARIVRPSADHPYVYRYGAHQVPGALFSPRRNANSIPVFCLGSPRDPEAIELDEEGAEQCQSIGPLGSSGSFVHDFELKPKFSCFLLLHSFAGVQTNSIQVLDKNQGGQTRGLYAEIKRAMATQEDKGLKPHEVLLQIEGVEQKAYGKTITVPVVTAIGEATGKYEKYALTPEISAEAKDKMAEMMGLVVPWKTAHQVKEFLGISAKPDVEPFDGGTEGARTSAPDELE